MPRPGESGKEPDSAQVHCERLKDCDVPRGIRPKPAHVHPHIFSHVSQLFQFGGFIYLFISVGSVWMQLVSTCPCPFLTGMTGAGGRQRPRPHTELKDLCRFLSLNGTNLISQVCKINLNALNMLVLHLRISVTRAVEKKGVQKCFLEKQRAVTPRAERRLSLRRGVGRGCFRGWQGLVCCPGR